jgi:hypothetical protein
LFFEDPLLPELLLPLLPLVPAPLPDPTWLGLAVPPLIEVPAEPMPLEPCSEVDPLWPVAP